jgi:hypothetical protein
MIRKLPLILGSIGFIVVIGGATYEHLGIVPVWASAAPASLSMFQGEYGIMPQRFWIPIHPVTLALLALALIANWKTAARNFILVTIAGYAVILLTTFIFFVPELISITQSTFTATIDAELTRRAKLWEALSLVRLGVLFVLAVVLLLGLSKVERNT